MNDLSGLSADSYGMTNRELLETGPDEIWRRITDTGSMGAWMVGVTRASMDDPGHADGSSVGARIKLEGHAGKAGSWTCIGVTSEIGRHHLVREYTAGTVWLASFLASGNDADGSGVPYSRRVTHRLTQIDGARTELDTEVVVKIPGLPKSARRPAMRADRKALEASHRKLARICSGRTNRISFITDSWHTPCFL